MKQYAIYLNSAERFILILEDLWLALQASRVLSSKMSLCVCDISNFETVPTNECLDWGLIDASESKQNQQHPSLSIIKKGISKKGPQLDIDKERIKKDRDFCNFVVKITKSSFIVDSLYNNVNQKFYLDLLDERDLQSVADDSGVKGGFIRNINKILYLSNSEEEIKFKLDEMFGNDKSSRPTNLKMYKTAFYKFLSNE